MEEQNSLKKSNKILLGIMVGLIFGGIIFGGGTYYYINSINDKDTKSSNSTEDEKTNEECTSKEETIDSLNAMDRLINKFNFNAFFAQTLPNGKTSDFKDWQKLILAAAKTSYRESYTYIETDDGVVSKVDVLKTAKDMFGDNVTYNDGNYEEFKTYGFGTINQNKLEYVTSIYGEGVGGYKTPGIFADRTLQQSNIILIKDIPYKLTRIGDEYKLECYRVYYEMENPGSGKYTDLYKDYEKRNIVSINNENKDGVTYYGAMTDKVVSEIKRIGSEGKLSIVTYTFGTENANIVWTGYNVE